MISASRTKAQSYSDLKKMQGFIYSSSKMTRLLWAVNHESLPLFPQKYSAILAGLCIICPVHSVHHSAACQRLFYSWHDIDGRFFFLKKINNLKEITTASKDGAVQDGNFVKSVLRYCVLYENVLERSNILVEEKSDLFHYYKSKKRV